ncbi:DNA-directed DNA polymerase [Tanacetum coccineum]
MAFRPYQLVQTKSIILHPGEVPKHQPDVCFPVNNDQSVSVELSLGFSVLGSTSSVTEQSSLPMMKGLSPSKHMELVNAARSLSLYLSAEDNDSFIKSSSSEMSSLAINKRLMAPQDISPTYKDVLATQVNGPMKKRKERPKRIEFGQVAAEQLNEPNQKKRKVQKKIKCGPIVKNEVTEQLESCIRETIKGSDIKLVIQKLLYMSDLKKSQNRLNMPINQLETKDFLTNEEKTDLESVKEIVVPLLGPTLRMYAEPMKLKIRPMGRTNNYVLMNKWNNFVEENKDYLKQLSTIQLWSFRVDQQLCFALAVVESPMTNGVNEVA